MEFADLSEVQTIEEIERLCCDVPALHPNIGLSWYRALRAEFSRPYFRQLSEFLVAERRVAEVFPKEEHVYSWTRHFPVDQVKVVILGQQPYLAPNEAHGLAFSAQPGTAVPASLREIYKVLKSDIDEFTPPMHGCLTGWAEQGVLLLNTALTVRKNAPKSHVGKGWEIFTSAVIKAVALNNKGVVFMIWGNDAQEAVNSLGTGFLESEGHHVWKTSHPSPLTSHDGFHTCHHFSRCNKILEEQSKSPINWCHLPDPRRT